LPSNLQRTFDSICADDLSSVANELGCHKCGIADAASYVQDPHARLDSGLGE
jgi:hypothetical protein